MIESKRLLMNSVHLERWLRRGLPYFLLLVWIITVVIVFLRIHMFGGGGIADWLINYQGGMVRRGLFGELVYQFSSFTETDPSMWIVGTQVVSFSGYFFFSYLLLKRQSCLLRYSWLIFSPFIFIFQINNLFLGYKKEIIFLVVLAGVVWAGKTLRDRTFRKVFYGVMLFYPVLILSHEASAILLPYLLLVYVIKTNLNRHQIKTIFLLALPSLMAFSVVLYYTSISPDQLKRMVDSIHKMGYVHTNGYIFLVRSLKDLQPMDYYLDHKYFIYYPQLILISLIAFIPVRHRLKVFWEKGISIALIVTVMSGSVVLFYIAGDWGRWIYIHLVAWFLLSTLPSLEAKMDFPIKKKLGSYLFILLLMVYFLFWRIPAYTTPYPYQNIVFYLIEHRAEEICSALDLPLVCSDEPETKK